MTETLVCLLTLVSLPPYFHPTKKIVALKEFLWPLHPVSFNKVRGEDCCVKYTNTLGLPRKLLQWSPKLYAILLSFKFCFKQNLPLVTDNQQHPMSRRHNKGLYFQTFVYFVRSSLTEVISSRVFSNSDAPIKFFTHHLGKKIFSMVRLCTDGHSVMMISQKRISNTIQKKVFAHLSLTPILTHNEKKRTFSTTFFSVLRSAVVCMREVLKIWRYLRRKDSRKYEKGSCRRI